MLSGETKRIITEFRSRSQDDQCTSAQREKLTKTANYFERNLTLYGLPNLLGKGLADCFRSD